MTFTQESVNVLTLYWQSVSFGGFLKSLINSWMQKCDTCIQADLCPDCGMQVWANVCVCVCVRESVFSLWKPITSSDLYLSNPSVTSSCSRLPVPAALLCSHLISQSTVWLLCLSLCCVPGYSGCPKAVTQREVSRDVIFRRAACIFCSPLFLFPAMNIHFPFADNGCTSHLRWPWKVCQGCFYQGIR